MKLSSVRRVSLVPALTAASVILLAACGGGGGGPTIDSLGCAPEVVETDETVSCSPSVEEGADTYIWSAAGGSPTSGTETSFSTRYAAAGSATISLLVCRAGRCNDASQTIDVNAPASTSEPRPSVGFLNCLPTLVLASESVVCNPTIKGTVTDYSWSTSPGGSPASGRESTFTTTYGSTGTKRISLQACNNGGCSNKLQSVLVGPLPDPLDSDDDGVIDRFDNCQFTENPDQSDVDGDRAGDACDSQDNRDPDGDGIQTWEDPCPSEAEDLNGYLDSDGCPEDPEVAVSIQQGDGSVFAPGEAVTICYSAGGPMFVDIDLVAPSGARSDLLSAFDLVGTGDCFEWASGPDAETGEYVVEITGSGADATASFEIAESG